MTMFLDLKQFLIYRFWCKFLNNGNAGGILRILFVQGGSNMTGTDLCVNKPHCAAAVRP